MSDAGAAAALREQRGAAHCRSCCSRDHRERCPARPLCFRKRNFVWRLVVSRGEVARGLSCRVCGGQLRFFGRPCPFELPCEFPESRRGRKEEKSRADQRLGRSSMEPLSQIGISSYGKLRFSCHAWRLGLRLLRLGQSGRDLVHAVLLRLVVVEPSALPHSPVKCWKPTNTSEPSGTGLA